MSSLWCDCMVLVTGFDWVCGSRESRSVTTMSVFERSAELAILGRCLEGTHSGCAFMVGDWLILRV
jgi:hypothetical protein